MICGSISTPTPWFLAQTSAMEDTVPYSKCWFMHPDLWRTLPLVLEGIVTYSIQTAYLKGYSIILSFHLHLDGEELGKPRELLEYVPIASLLLLWNVTWSKAMLCEIACWCTRYFIYLWMMVLSEALDAWKANPYIKLLLMSVMKKNWCFQDEKSFNRINLVIGHRLIEPVNVIIKGLIVGLCCWNIGSSKVVTAR